MAPIRGPKVRDPEASRLRHIKLLIHGVNKNKWQCFLSKFREKEKTGQKIEPTPAKTSFQSERLKRDRSPSAGPEPQKPRQRWATQAGRVAPPTSIRRASAPPLPGAAARNSGVGRPAPPRPASPASPAQPCPARRLGH
jgi:hypothetical protein